MDRPLQSFLIAILVCVALSAVCHDASAQFLGQRGGRSINQIIFGDHGNRGGKCYRNKHCLRWLHYFYAPRACCHHGHHGHHGHRGCGRLGYGHHGYGHHGIGHGHHHGCGPHGCGLHGYSEGAYGDDFGGAYDCGPGVGGSGSDLFYNYYAPQTGPEGGVTTQMYTSPHDTPHPAVQTYYTYQPCLPHEFLYEHNRNYLHYHNRPHGATEVHVSWGGSPIIRETDDPRRSP